MASIASSAPDQRQLQLIAASGHANEVRLREILAEVPSWTSHTDHDALRISLQRIAARGKLPLVQLLLEHGAEVNTRRERETPALVKAVEGGHTAVVSELLARKADPNWRNKQGHTPLFTACMRGHNDVVKALLDAGAAVDIRDNQGRTPLMYLASEKPGRWNVDTLKLIIAKDADIEAKDRSTGRTPLIWAATKGNTGLVDALLSGELGKTANIAAFNDRGRTALHLAAENNQQETVKILLTRGANVSATSDGGYTALHNASSGGHPGVAAQLLEAGADVNAVLSNGMTPLHWAAFNGHEEVVKVLLKDPNASLTMKDDDNRTPLLCAAEKQHREIVQLLSPVRTAERLSQAEQSACTEFEATVVDFGHFRDGKKQLVFKHSVHELLYGWNTDLNKPKVATSIKNVKYEPAFRWIHLPANNIAWVEALLANSFVEGGYRDIEAFKALYKCFDQEHRGPLAHAHFMRQLCHRISAPQTHVPEKEMLVPLSEEPSDMTQMSTVSNQATDSTPKKSLDSKKIADHGENGTPRSEKKKKTKGEEFAERHPKRPKRASGPPGNPPGTKAMKALSRSSTQLSLESSKLPPSNTKFVLFMPFLHYETDARRQEMSRAIWSVRDGRELPENPSRDVLLVNAYLRNLRPLHPRRTLDQFYYHGIDTTLRDTDQVVYRYCKRHQVEKKVFMVDQLWLWIFGRDLVVTCFPQRWNQPKQDPLNVLDGIIEESNAKTRPPIQTVYDLAMLITSRCSGMFDRHRLADQNLQFLDMFESSIGRVTNKESQLFKRFNDASELSAQWLHEHRRTPRGRPTRSSSPSPDYDIIGQDPVFPDALLDIGVETSLLAEIKDIRDELNIIKKILDSQMSILKQLETHITDELRTEGSRKVTDVVVAEIQKRSREQKRLLEDHQKDIERMDEQAKSIYNSLTNLLDLKQKHSNALEARFARDHAVIAAKQGQTIMMFTIVTISFLPMSFIATLFTINLKDWDGRLTFAEVSKYVFGIGLGISIPLIAMAFAVTDIFEAVRGMFSTVRNGFFFRRKWRRYRQLHRVEDEIPGDKAETYMSKTSMAEDIPAWKKRDAEDMSPRIRPIFHRTHESINSGMSPVSGRVAGHRKFSIGSAWARPNLERGSGKISEDLERGRGGDPSGGY